MPATSDPLLLVLAAAVCAACVATVLVAWHILGRLKGAEKHLERLQDLAVLKERVERLAGQTSELDLRRLEHVLLDLRDATKRSEERMLTLIESTRAGAGGSSLPVAGAGSAALLAERIVTRLLALGYEKVQIVTSRADLEPLLAGEGAVTVEARRDGVSCKGRVTVKAGSIQDLQLQAAYSAFP